MSYSCLSYRAFNKDENQQYKQDLPIVHIPCHFKRRLSFSVPQCSVFSSYAIWNVFCSYPKDLLSRPDPRIFRSSGTFFRYRTRTSGLRMPTWWGRMAMSCIWTWIQRYGGNALRQRCPERTISLASNYTTGYCSKLVFMTTIDSSWYPSVPGLAYSNETDDEYQGHHILKGRIILENIW